MRAEQGVRLPPNPPTYHFGKPVEPVLRPQPLHNVTHGIKYRLGVVLAQVEGDYNDGMAILIPLRTCGTHIGTMEVGAYIVDNYSEMCKQ